MNNYPNFFEKYLSFGGQKKIKAWSQFNRCLNFFFKNNFLFLYLIVPFLPYGSIIICSSVYCCHLLEMNIFVVQGGSEIISRVDVAVSTTSRFQRNTNTKHKKNTNTKHKAQDTNTKHKAQSRFQQWRILLILFPAHSTLAEAVDKALETRNFHEVYDLIEVSDATF